MPMEARNTMGTSQLSRRSSMVARASATAMPT